MFKKNLSSLIANVNFNGVSIGIKLELIEILLELVSKTMLILVKNLSELFTNSNSSSWLSIISRISSVFGSNISYSLIIFFFFGNKLIKNMELPELNVDGS